MLCAARKVGIRFVVLDSASNDGRWECKYAMINNRTDEGRWQQAVSSLGGIMVLPVGDLGTLVPVPCDCDSRGNVGEALSLMLVNLPTSLTLPKRRVLCG